MISVYKNALVKDLSNAEYHGALGSYSSSQIKDALEDIEYFHKKHILKEIVREESPAFDLGTYFHTAILEPEKLAQECAVFSGVRRGKAWEDFKEANKGKAIITETEFSQAQGIIEAVKNSKIAMNRINRGIAEYSGFLEVKISGSDIYAGDLILGQDGWEETLQKPSKNSLALLLKVRADCLGEDFVLDLKSTTGNCRNEWLIKNTITRYHYDLSAALYLDVFSVLKEKPLKDFIWVFASKDFLISKSYLASQENLRVGRAKYKKALLRIAEGIKNNWEFPDTLTIIGPQAFEAAEYLREDLL